MTIYSISQGMCFGNHRKAMTKSIIAFNEAPQLETACGLERLPSLMGPKALQPPPAI